MPPAVVAEVGFRGTAGGTQAVFIASALGLVPLAGLLGEATEHLAERAGPKLGGFLNTTLGNAAELSSPRPCGHAVPLSEFGGWRPRMQRMTR
ncbi:MAG: hypothetical protein ACP5NB_07530, partial [Chloroflexia bacterium]